MATVFEFIAGNLARLHARVVYDRFIRSLRRSEQTRAAALKRALAQIVDSEFGRSHRLATVRTLADLRGAVPLHTYEQCRPWIERVWNGEARALFSPEVNIRMFATSSGTTARQKLVPVTDAFIADYRRGWNTFGLKMYRDHIDAFLRGILQSTGRHDEAHAPSGAPCGAITGLLAMTQKGIVRRFYVGGVEVAQLPTATARFYTLMRLGVVRDVAYAITANPATLIQMAKIADENRHELIRDVHDGSLSPRITGNEPLAPELQARLSPNPKRAAELEQLLARHGALRPRDLWHLCFVACWTGGSMGHYLPRVRELWGDIPVRDIGLLASEGRVSIPLDDNTSIGVLDLSAGVFEFIPVDEFDRANPTVLGSHELSAGCDYGVVLTNTAGLIRYRLDDVVRVHGYLEGSPLVEFLYRGGRVSSLAGEKLTENQVIAAYRDAIAKAQHRNFDFALNPVWDEPPYYCLICSDELTSAFVDELDAALSRQNAEYASRRNSFRLGPLRIMTVGKAAFAAMDERLVARQRARAEQYKRPHLFTRAEDCEAAFGKLPPIFTSPTKTLSA
ncbi:MAG: GH3 auxin-responsive promoter family protein [Phycisphaerales bacterium]|nr:GH3 auxin-responsive promoter family protein [Phycisphaerales bacterium]